MAGGGGHHSSSREKNEEKRGTSLRKTNSLRAIYPEKSHRGPNFVPNSPLVPRTDKEVYNSQRMGEEDNLTQALLQHGAGGG